MDFVDERHRHRYEVNPKYVSDLEKNGMRFTGQSEDGNRMEIMELRDRNYFVGVQYHPEYISRPYKPSAPYVGFILAASDKLKSYTLASTSSSASLVSIASSADLKSLSKTSNDSFIESI